MKNFKNRDFLSDKFDLEQKLGPPMEVNTSDYSEDYVVEYSYDAYTKLILDCADGTRDCRCKPKY